MPLYDDFGTVPYIVSNGIKIHNIADSQSGFSNISNTTNNSIEKKFYKSLKSRFLIGLSLSTISILSICLIAYLIFK